MSQCYDWNPETSEVEPLSDVWVQCPSGLTCCVGGSQCLDHNLCHAPGGHTGAGSFSSYYVARCADPTYTSPDCQKVCNAPGPPDAVYNFTSTQWNCCGLDAAGNVSCNDPTAEAFQAPAPAALATLSSQVAVASTATLIPGSKTTSSSSSTSTLTSTSATATTTPSSSSSSSSSSSASSADSSSSSSTATGLSGGAKAGIGIGVALGILALLAVLALVLLRRRKRSADLPPPVYTDRPATAATSPAKSYEKPAEAVFHGAELPAQESRVGGGGGGGYVPVDQGWGGGRGGVHEIGTSR